MEQLEFKKKVLDIVNVNKARPFMVLNQCNFIKAMDLLLSDHNISLSEMEIYQKKRIEGKYLASGTVVFVSIGMEVKMETYGDKKGNWYYSFID